MDFLKKYWGLFVVLFVCYAATASIFAEGFFPVHDAVQPTRIYQMAKSIQDGMFPVRWVNDLGFGYGYPIFNFYAPLPYYAGSLFYFLGADAIGAAKIMFAIPVFLAGIGMYAFVRSFLGQSPAVVSACIYVLFPYFALNIFVRGAVGEYYAYSFLPFIFWGLFKIYYIQVNHKNVKIYKKSILSSLPEQNYLKPVVVSALFLGLLIISHNLSAYMILLYIFIFLTMAVLTGKHKKQLIISYLLVLLTAFLISAFYTLPALFEVQYTDVKSQLAGNFDFAMHYVCPSQWWESPWGFAGSSAGCIADGISFRLGKSNIFFAFAGVATFLYLMIPGRYKKHRFLFVYFLIALVFTLFMMTDFSKKVWELLPGIEFLQFPWRFMNFAGLTISVLSGFFIYFVDQKKKKAGFLILVVTVFLTMSLNLKLYKPQKYINTQSDYYTNSENVNFVHSKLTNEYMPDNFVRPKNKNELPNTPFSLESGQGNVEVIENKIGKATAIVRLENDGNLTINKAYFPAWKLYANRTEIALKEIERGMRAYLGKGEHYVSLEFVQTPIQITGNSLTISGIIVLIAVIIMTGKRKNYDTENK